MVNAFRQELKRKKIITEKNLLTKDAAEKIAEIDFAHDTLNDHAIKLKEAFNALMKQKGSRKVKVENGDVQPIENATCKYVEEDEFKRLLDTLTKHLTKRTLYTFDLDTDAFIARCIRKTNEYFAGEKLELLTTIETGNVSFDNSGKVVTDSPEVDEDASEYSRMPDEFRKTDLQIVDHIMYHTMMPRLAILEILRGFGNRELLNSQDILEEYTKLLNNELTLAKAAGLKAYEVVKDYQLDAAKILEADVIDEELFAKQIKRVYQSDAAKRKAVHAYYNTDSDGEYDFAKDLDKDPNVLLFSKLKKGGFVIDTPHGNYSPDWAIVYRKEDGHLKLFFVVETKFDKNEQNLTGVEEDKINCGKLHFAAVSDEIKFDWANSYKDFERKFVKSQNA